MKPNGGRTRTVVVVAALFCVVVAVGAGLEGRFTFAGPLWTPGVPRIPAIKVTPHPLPAGAGNSSQAPAVHQNTVLSLVVLLVVLAILAAAVIVAIVWLWRRYHPKREKVVDFLGDSDVAAAAIEPQPDLPTLQRGLALAADILQQQREPKDAIVRAWIGLQEAAEDSGVRRRSSETPTEFTSRVFSAVRADREAADTLLQVYLRVRFGSRPATDEDAAIARDAVARLTATWSVRS